jgi:hypothetical protein
MLRHQLSLEGRSFSKLLTSCYSTLFLCFDGFEYSRVSLVEMGGRVNETVVETIALCRLIAIVVLATLSQDREG